jgi:hypothetical protein
MFNKFTYIFLQLLLQEFIQRRRKAGVESKGNGRNWNRDDISLPDHFMVVPYYNHTIKGISVQECLFGKGVFWDGPEVLPCGVFVTIYPGRIQQLKLPLKRTFDSSYTIALAEYYKKNVSLRKNFQYFLNANPEMVGDVSHLGVGHLVNSCSPMNWDPIAQLPNVVFTEIPPDDEDMEYFIVIQTIDNIQPGEQLYADYHDMLYEDSPVYVCCCTPCQQKAHDKLQQKLSLL